MNKSELAAAIAASTGISKADATKAIDGFTAVVTSALADGKEVALIGFGTFKTSQRAEREGRNPATGEAITIKAMTTPKFTAGKALKDALN